MEIIYFLLLQLLDSTPTQDTGNPPKNIPK